MIGVSLFRCFFYMDFDGRCALGLGFYWEDMAVKAGGLGYGISAICALGRADRNKTVDLPYLVSRLFKLLHQ